MAPSERVQRMSDEATNDNECIDHTDAETLRHLYHDKDLTTYEIADRSEVSPTQIRYSMDKHNIEREDPSESGRPEVDYVHYKTDIRGYEVWRVYRPETQKTITFPVHRLVAIAEYGVEAVAGNDIHHKNEITWDNRPENLEPLPRGEHLKLHK